MLTRTSLNEAFLNKCRAAARRAIRNAAAWGTTGQAYIDNRRGRLMMRVDYSPERGLRFWEGSRKDVTPLIAGALGGAL